MAEYRLYAHKNSYAMTTQLMLEELGIDYDVTWFNVHRPEEFPPDFLELNPNARVPVLITPDGPLYESAATMMHLAEHHQSRFMPPGGRRRDRAAVAVLPDEHVATGGYSPARFPGRTLQRKSVCFRRRSAPPARESSGGLRTRSAMSAASLRPGPGWMRLAISRQVPRTESCEINPLSFPAVNDGLNRDCIIQSPTPSDLTRALLSN